MRCNQRLSSRPAQILIGVADAAGQVHARCRTLVDDVFDLHPTIVQLDEAKSMPKSQH